MVEVSCTQRGPSKESAAAGILLRVLALRQQVEIASPLVASHVAGDLNVLGNINYIALTILNLYPL